MYVLIAIVGVMSLLAFVLYYVDKRRAIKGKYRIPEVVLLGCSLLGGALGGYISMFAFHHKTRKWYFHIVNIVGIILIIGAFAYCIVR